MIIRGNRSAPGALGATTQTVEVLAPAKINLHLEVLGKRPDGYHAIETVMLAVELYDELALDMADPGVLSLACDDPELSAGPDNLVMKAATILHQKLGETRGANIRLTKRIPWAAGLGGGSSDAAATLAGLNVLWNLGLTTEELMAIGAELGSDVPFFFRTPAALCTGRGEVVTPVPVGKAFELVLVKPAGGLSTAEVYREHGSLSAPYEISNPHRLHEALASGDCENLGRLLLNRLQEPAMKLCPLVAELLTRLRATGPAGCLMSGSGSCLFALCRDEGEATRVADDLRRGLPPGTDLARSRIVRVRSCF